MAEEPDLSDIKRRMDGAQEALRREFAGLRTGRASASLLEPITVDAYGAAMPLNQVATIGVPEPRMITVQVWDRKLAGAVEKAIQGGDVAGEHIHHGGAYRGLPVGLGHPGAREVGDVEDVHRPLAV
ncbi:MAG: ribosome recycling factor [Proteobacteria bacterium]|nr:ribosome recycling factor [Pseudomonadota bacterium]